MPPPPIPAPAAGAGQISAYEEVKALGKGAFGVVYLVRERATKRKWVMKRVALKGMQPRERQSAFQEARLLQRLRHPHICSYQDSFVNKATNQLCLVMTFCPGGDMHGYVQDHKKRNKRVAEEQIVQWLVQLTLALEYIHERHIIHRDLKTQNVFLMDDRSLKLGAARDTNPGLQLASPHLASAHAAFTSPRLAFPSPRRRLWRESRARVADRPGAHVRRHALLHVPRADAAAALLEQGGPVGARLHRVRADHAQARLRRQGHGRPHHEDRTAAWAE